MKYILNKDDLVILKGIEANRKTIQELEEKSKDNPQDDLVKLLIKGKQIEQDKLYYYFTSRGIFI